MGCVGLVYFWLLECKGDMNLFITFPNFQIGLNSNCHLISSLFTCHKYYNLCIRHLKVSMKMAYYFVKDLFGTIYYFGISVQC